MKPLLIAACTLLATTTALAQQDAIDLFDDDWVRAWRELPLYVPEVPPQVTRLCSDAEATRFATAAWGEDKKELHVDFKNEQVLVAAWGAMRCAENSLGASTRIQCEQLLLGERTLKVRLRTLLPPGPGIDLPHDDEHPGRTFHPSLFLVLPLTERLEVDVVGSRRSDAARDFPIVGQKSFEVRVHPDATPIREQISVITPSDSVTGPQVTFDDSIGEHVLDLAWGKLGAGAYRLELIEAALRDGVLHATVCADNVPIMLYSGPGEHQPRLCLQLPPVRSVRLRIVRSGNALPEGTPDFQASASKRLVVTVDDRSVKRTARR